jgi:DNA-binding GntR family transcriptional regulator
LAAVAGRAKYQEVAADLRTKITNDTYEAGSELPSTTKLMQMHSVSSTVVKQAIKELKTEGLVVGQPGKGVYVLRKPGAPESSAEYIELMNTVSTMRDALVNEIHSIQERLADIEATLARMQPEETPQLP